MVDKNKTTEPNDTIDETVVDTEAQDTEGAEKKTRHTVKGTRISRDGKVYEPGQHIMLTSKDAEKLKDYLEDKK